MEHRQLGSTGIEVSVLGLGTVKLGRNTGVDHARPFRVPTIGEARRLIDRARSLGINLIDTAPAYGKSEERLGGLLAGQRQRWVIVTKVGEEFDGARSTHDFSPEHTAMSVRRSLERLDTDYLDVVLIHSDGDDEHILNDLGTLDCLKQLKEKGVVRAVGISHKSPNGARAALDKGADVIMATLNPADLSEAESHRESRKATLRRTGQESTRGRTRGARSATLCGSASRRQQRCRRHPGPGASRGERGDPVRLRLIYESESAAATGSRRD